MPMKSSLAALLLALFALVSVTPAQERGDARTTISKYERFLDRKPFNDRAFEQMVTAAVSINALDELIERYEERLEAGASLGPRVILARLLAKADRHQEALDVLAEHLGEDGEGGDPHVLRIVGFLEMERGRASDAVGYLDRAAELSEDRELLEDIHRLRGEAWLAEGDRDAAARAFQDLARLEPESFSLRLDAADSLAHHGLHQVALEEYAIAVELAGNDVARRCRVLAEIGKLHEALAQGEEALESYRAAIELMNRGHWLKRDLYNRVLSLHERTGQLERLLDSAREDVSLNPGDLDARAFLARALVRAKEYDEAREVLHAATEEFPSDLPLGREKIDVLRHLEDWDGVVVEYQRLLEEHPNELELYLELGQTFAASGRLEQAARQWQETLEQRLDDPSLCVRLAGLYALYGQQDEAVELYERAIELEPAELRHYADLALFLVGLERADDARAIVERAESASVEDPARLSEVVGLWRQLGDLDRARGALEQALVLAPEDAHLLYRLADLQLAAQDVEVAIETLHDVLRRTEEGNLRRTATERLVRLFSQAERTDELVAREQAAIEADPTDPVPHVILGRMMVLLRRPDDAEKHYLKLLELEPDREDSRVALAKLAEDRADFAGALAHYEALMEERPQARRRWLDRVASIHLARYDQDKAFECYEEILAGAPNNPAAFREVATHYQRLGMIDEAADCLKQVVRLEPDDHRTRLRLAELYRTLGELHSAEREVQTALGADEVHVVDDARTMYYELLSSAGRVTDEVKALRKRVEDNPYDLEAPLTLVDIYVRELEYELALEVLERLLGYQPDQAHLSQERARLLALLERYDEAIEVLEVLLKEGELDREDVALDLAEAALEDGNAEKAAEVLVHVPSALRVSRLYRKKERWTEAIQVLERGLAASPHDRRLLGALADVHEARGDEDSAIAAMERGIDLLGDSFGRLERLGHLYHQVGRTDDAIACGRRLFLLIREIEEEEDDDDEQGKPKAPTQRSLWWWNRGRVTDVSAYFRDISCERDFALIGAEEVLLQPTNYTLFNTVLNQLMNLEGEGARGLELIESVRTATVEKERHPDGYTLTSWIRTLDSRRVRVYDEDIPFAEERLAAFAATEESGSITSTEYDEWAAALGQLTRPAEKIEVLSRAVERFPQDTSLRAGMARALYSEKRYDEALPHYEQLVELATANPPDAEERVFLDELNFKRSKHTTLQAFPRHVRRKVNDEALREFHGLTRSSDLYLSSGPGTLQYPGAARMSLATCLGKADRKDEASRILHELANDRADSLSARIRVANALNDLDLFDEARAMYEGLAEREQELSAHAIFGFNRAWERQFSTPMSKLARIHEREESYVDAFHMLRTYGDPKAAELTLTTGGAIDAAKARYAAERDESERGDDRWRDSTVRLAEVHQIAKEWDRALELYQEIAVELPSDFKVQDQIATLHLRAGRVDETISTHRSIIAAKRELNLRPLKAEKPPGRVLTPVAPPMPPERHYAWRNLSYSYYSRGPKPNHSYRENYVAILKLLLDRGRIEEATDVMRDLARSDVQTFSWLGYSLSQVIDQYQLGAAGLPILRLVHSHNPSYSRIGVQFAEALIAAKRWDEARRVLITMRDQNSSTSYQGRQARQMLDTLDAREGVDSRKSTAELRAEVEEDPKAIKARLELIPRLLEEREFEEALEHALVAEELAPHKEEVTTYLHNLLQLVDRQDELESRLAAKIDTMDDNDDRMAAAGRIAQWRWDRGDREGAEEILERAARRSSSQWDNYTPAGFYFEKGELERALEIVMIDLEAAPKHRHGPILRSKSTIERALGDITPLLDTAWEESFEKVSAEGDKEGILRALATPLQQIAHLDRERDRWIAKFEQEHEGLRAALYCSAVELACGDLDAVDARLRSVAAPTGDTRFLIPLLVTLARTRGDQAGALALLEELYEAGAGSQSAQVSTSVGMLSERNALRGEIGSLRYELGDEQGALELWEEMFDPDDDSGRRTLVNLYRTHGMTQRAADELAAYLQEVGERELGDVQLLGDLFQQLDQLEEAIATWKRALVLANNASEQVQLASRLLDAYRTLDRIPEYAAELEAAAELDPGDIDVRKRWIRVVAETGDRDRAYELLEGLSDLPEQELVVLPTLINRARLAGDIERVIELTRRKMEIDTSEYSRRSTSRQLADLLFEQERDEEALEALEAAFEDPEAPRSLTEIARRIQNREGYEEKALELMREANRLQPDGGYANQLVYALARRDQHAEALALIREMLEDERRKSRARNMINLFAMYAEKVDGAIEGIRAEVEEKPEDLNLRLIAAELAKKDDDTDGALDHLRAAAEAHPEDPLPKMQLLALLKNEDLNEEALEVTLELIAMSELELGVSGLKQTSGGVTTHRKTRADLLLEMGDVEAAEAALKDDLGMRYKRPQTYQWRHGNFNKQIDRQLLDFWANQQEWEKVLEIYSELERYTSVQEDRWYEARVRTGEEEVVLEELWNDLVDESSALFQGSSNGGMYGLGGFGYSFGGYYIYDSFEMGRSSGSWGLLLRLHAERGSIDELEAQVEAALEEDPDLSSLKSLQRRLIERSDRQAELLPDAEQKMADDPWNAKAIKEVVDLLFELERHAEAVPLLERLVTMQEAAAFDSVTGWNWYTSSNPTGSLRFKFASGNGAFFSTSNSYSSRSGSSADTERRRLIVALYHAGQPERARELEEIEEVRRRSQELSGNAASSPLYGLFAAADLHDEAQRVAAAELERSLSRIEEKEDTTLELQELQVRTNHAVKLAHLWKDEDDEKRLAFAQQAMDGYLRLHENVLEKAAEKGDDPFAGRFSTLAQRRLDLLDDVEGARADMVRYEELRDEDQLWESITIGWIYYQLGEFERAHEIFERNAERYRYGWYSWNADTQIGLRLCKAKTGTLTDDDRRNLRRALYEKPTHKRADEVRALLEGSE